MDTYDYLNQLYKHIDANSTSVESDPQSGTFFFTINPKLAVYCTPGWRYMNRMDETQETPITVDFDGSDFEGYSLEEVAYLERHVPFELTYDLVVDFAQYERIVTEYKNSFIAAE